MNPLIGGSLIGGALNGISSLFNAGKQYRNQKKLMEQQHQYNLETMAQQNKYNVENWERNNAYNDPSAVAARYQRAGMDVNQAFGGSSHYTPSQSAAGAAPVGTGAPTVPLSDQLDLGSALDTALKVAQIRNIDADSDQKRSQTGDREQYLRSQVLENDYKEFRNDMAGLDVDLKNVELARRTFDYQFLLDTRAISIQTMEQNYRNLQAEYDRILADTNLKSEQRNKVLEDIAVAKAQVEAVKAGTALTWKEVDAYKYKVRELVTATDANAALRKFNFTGANLNQAKEKLVRLKAIEQAIRNDWVNEQERVKLINEYANTVHSVLSLIPGVG